MKDKKKGSSVRPRGPSGPDRGGEKLTHGPIRGGSYSDQQEQLRPKAQTQVAFVLPMLVDPTAQKDPYAAVIARLDGTIRKQAAAYGVPVQALQGVLYYEQRDRSAIGDSWGKFWQKPTVSLGLAQIQVQRAAELDRRNVNENPLSSEEFDELAAKLENEETNIQYLARELADNFKHYGKVSGKTDSDRWRFAVAKHKGGHGPVGEAQVKAEQKGKNKNVWADVAPELGGAIREFVDDVFAYRQPAASGTVMA